MKIKEEKIPKNRIWETLGRGILKGAREGAIGAGLGKIAGKLVDKITKVKSKDISDFSKWKIDISSGLLIGSAFQYGPEVIKSVSKYYSSKKK